jgi:hypothetical protein
MADITTEAGFKIPVIVDNSKPHLVSSLDNLMSPFDKITFEKIVVTP